MFKLQYRDHSRQRLARRRLSGLRRRRQPGLVQPHPGGHQASRQRAGGRGLHQRARHQHRVPHGHGVLRQRDHLSRRLRRGGNAGLEAPLYVRHQLTDELVGHAFSWSVLRSDDLHAHLFVPAFHVLGDLHGRPGHGGGVVLALHLREVARRGLHLLPERRSL